MAKLLYQQGVQKLEIIVRKDTSGSPNGTKGLATGKAGATQSEDMGDSIDESTKTKTLKQFAIASAIQLTKQTAFAGFDYYVGGIGMQNGDQALQDQINGKINLYKDVIDVGSSIAMGAIAGSAFGPVGTIVGGLIGVVGSGISMAQRQMERKREYNYTIFKENNSIAYNRARAGISSFNGRDRVR